MDSRRSSAAVRIGSCARQLQQYEIPSIVVLAPQLRHRRFIVSLQPEVHSPPDQSLYKGSNAPFWTAYLSAHQIMAATTAIAANQSTECRRMDGAPASVSSLAPGGNGVRQRQQ